MKVFAFFTLNPNIWGAVTQKINYKLSYVSIEYFLVFKSITFIYDFKGHQVKT